MNASCFICILLLICGITLQGCQCLPHRKLQSKYDDKQQINQKIINYFKSLPRVKNGPQNVVKNHFFHRLSSQLSTSEADRISRSFVPKAEKPRTEQKRQTWHFAVIEVPQECEPSKVELMKQKIRQKIKEISSSYNLPKNWSQIKSQSVESMCKVKNYIKNSNIKEKLKNITHPLRYKGSKCGNQTTGEMNCDVSRLHIHPKSSHVEKITHHGAAAGATAGATAVATATSQPSVSADNLIKTPNAKPMTTSENLPQMSQRPAWEILDFQIGNYPLPKDKNSNPVKTEGFVISEIRVPNQPSSQNDQSDYLIKYSGNPQTGKTLPFLDQTLKEMPTPLTVTIPPDNLIKASNPFQSFDNPNRIRPILPQPTLPQDAKLLNRFPFITNNLMSKSQVFSTPQIQPLGASIEHLPISNEIPLFLEFPKLSKTAADSPKFSANFKNLLEPPIRLPPLPRVEIHPEKDRLSIQSSVPVKPLPLLTMSSFKNLSLLPELHFESPVNPFTIPLPSSYEDILPPPPLKPLPKFSFPLESIEVKSSFPALSHPHKISEVSSTILLPLENPFLIPSVQQQHRKHPASSTIQFLFDAQTKPSVSYPRLPVISQSRLKPSKDFLRDWLGDLDFPKPPPLPPPDPLESSRFLLSKKSTKKSIDPEDFKISSKVERNVYGQSSLANAEKDNTNSTHVLETAGEMASDLAGRVTNLWHCVLGSHRVPDTRDVKFFLYTRRNIIQPELLEVNYDLINKKLQTNPEFSDIDCYDISPDQIDDFERISDKNRNIIRSNYLNIRAPTKILIHGYTGSYRDSRMAKIKDAYLNKGRYNVIQVDWEVLAAPPCYIRVTHHSKFVGETIAQLLNGLFMVGVNMSLVHLVGFSLGAQVAGFTGNNVTIVPICRITGLDPALPLFLHTQPSGHLDKLDAKFVDVIHTCGGILAMLDPLGHVDFYPNGGTRQPGCEFSNLKCSHSRAPQYFAESVNSVKKFTGQLCLTWEEFVAGDCDNSSAYMGEPCSRKSTFGKYYLLTKSKEPFVL